MAHTSCPWSYSRRNKRRKQFQFRWWDIDLKQMKHIYFHFQLLMQPRPLVWQPPVARTGTSNLQPWPGYEMNLPKVFCSLDLQTNNSEIWIIKDKTKERFVFHTIVVITIFDSVMEFLLSSSYKVIERFRRFFYKV